MVRTILSTLVMTAAMLAVSGSTAYAEEVCAEAGVAWDSGAPLVETQRRCQPSSFTTVENQICVGDEPNVPADACVATATP